MIMISWDSLVSTRNPIIIFKKYVYLLYHDHTAACFHKPLQEF